MNTESNEVVETVETVENKITFSDGEVKNFGSRSRLISDQSIDEDLQGYILKFYTILGDILVYHRRLEAPTDRFTLEQAAFGADAKIKASTGGTAPEKLVDVIQTKINEFNLGKFASRSVGVVKEVTPILTQVQSAWGRLNGYDINTVAGINGVHDYFKTLTNEQTKEIGKEKRIQLELKRIRMEVAQANYEKFLKEQAEAENA